jgi:hypothetical protein
MSHQSKRRPSTRGPDDVLGKQLDWSWVIIQEVEIENWGWGGMLVAQYRKMKAAEAQGREGGSHDR